MDFDIQSTPVTKYKNRKKMMQEKLLNSRSSSSGTSKGSGSGSNSTFKKLSGSFNKSITRVSDEYTVTGSVNVGMGWMD